MKPSPTSKQNARRGLAKSRGSEGQLRASSAAAAQTHEVTDVGTVDAACCICDGDDRSCSVSKHALRPSLRLSDTKQAPLSGPA